MRKLNSKHREIMFPYQKADCDQFHTALDEHKLAVCLWEQGLGKSLMALTMADERGHVHVLILCPAIGRLSWADEIKRWQIVNRDVKIIKTGAQAKTLKRPATGGSIVVCTMDLCRNADVRRALREYGFTMAVIDEAQQLRNPLAKRTQAVYSRRDGVIKDIDEVIIMSGTIIVSWPLDLWAHLKRFTPERIMMNGGIMSFEQFRSRFHVTTKAMYPGMRQPTTKIVRARNLDELHQRTRGWAVRRRKGEVLTDLPPMMTYPWLVEGDARSKRELLDNLAHELPAEIVIALKNAKTEQDMQIAMQRIASSSAHVAKLIRLTGMAKAAPVAKALSDELADSTYKIGIFAWNLDVVDALADGLAKYKPAVITGRTSTTARQTAMTRFMSGDECRVFIGQIAACGTALTLTAASRVVFVQQSWTPGDNAQAAARFHRIGQTESVSVRLAMLADTIDEPLNQVLGRKTAAAMVMEDDFNA